MCYLLWSWLLPLSVRLGRIPCQLLKNLSLSTFNDLSRKQLLGSCWWGLKDSEQSSTSVSFIESEQTVLPRSLPYLQPRGALRDSFHSRAEKRATAPLCCMAKLRQESKGQDSVCAEQTDLPMPQHSAGLQKGCQDGATSRPLQCKATSPSALRLSMPLKESIRARGTERLQLPCSKSEGGEL